MNEYGFPIQPSVFKLPISEGDEYALNVMFLHFCMEEPVMEKPHTCYREHLPRSMVWWLKTKTCTENPATEKHNVHEPSVTGTPAKEQQHCFD